VTVEKNDDLRAAMAVAQDVAAAGQCELDDLNGQLLAAC